MKPVFISILFLVAHFTNAQNIIEWDGIYQLQLSDFQAATTQVGETNVYHIQMHSGIEFGFNMLAAEFMFTKNFNGKVNCVFNRDASSLLAPDSITAQNLVNYARYYFDLSELHARKLRKKLYESKGAFSNSDFFTPIYNEVQKELTERNSEASHQSDLGANPGVLAILHSKVLMEIEAYADFCKTCKPPKKKKPKIN